MAWTVLPWSHCDAAAGDAFETLFSHQGYVKKGDKGDLVRALQEALDAVGYRTSADGIFGEGTRASLVSFQDDHGLYPDAVAGPATLDALSLEYYRENPPATHTVKAGETLSSIGERYALSVALLLRINHLSDADTIYAGQELRLQEDEAKPETPIVLAPVIPAPQKRVCLSFDDGPDIYTTRQVLSILDAYGVKATFFLVGDKAARNPDLVKQISAAGHVIGVHGYDHKVLSGLSASEVRKDLKKAQDVITGITGVTPHLYRPPSGLLDRTQVDEADKLGLTTLMWTNIGGADLRADSALEVVSGVTSGVKDGGVILLHEGLQKTVEALPALIEALARLGFGFQNVTAPVQAQARP